MDIYNLAYNEQFDEVKERISEEPNMAIMGFSAKQLVLLKGAIDRDEIRAVGKTLSDEEKKRVQKLDDMILWCASKGATLLFGINQKLKKITCS